MTWSPLQYERFADERSQPFYDLMSLVRLRSGLRVVDLGCGTGKLTRVLAEHLDAARTLGVDSSAEMLAAAAGERAPNLSFVQGDVAAIVNEVDGGREWAGPWDLVFSNAALHWVSDHERLLARVSERIAEGGQLAVQVPANFDHLSHTVADEVAREEPFASALAGALRGNPILSPEAYAVLLDRLGFRAQHVRLQVYPHSLASREEVIEWVKGTLLTFYKQRLSDTLYDKFLARYRERLLPLLEDRRPYFYPFKRILLWGEK